MKKYLLAIDQGTTGTTVMITTSDSLEIKSSVTINFKQYYPSESMVEHDLNEIWRTVEEATLKALKKADINSNDIISIGITNQRETTCAYDKKGTPLAHAIVWQDRRTNNFCIENQTAYKKLKVKTGLPLDPYFSGTKMSWLLNHNVQVKKAALDNNLNLSTIDSFLLFKLTDGKSYKTDATNASRTLLMNLNDCQWDEELLSFFAIKKDYLPRIEPNISSFGSTLNCSFLPDGIAIECMIGDQQSALLGHVGVDKGDLKCTYGTGAFLLLNTGEEIIQSNHGLLTTVALSTHEHTYYALEGSTYIAGAAIAWLRDNLELALSVLELEELARSASDEDIQRLFFFPFFTGIGTPYWSSEARATITGMSRGTGKSHISRAALEGVALSVQDTLEIFATEFSKPIKKMKVDGGASRNDLLMEMQANFSNLTIERPLNIETTAMGAIIGCKLFHNGMNFSDIKKIYKKDKEFMVDKSPYHQEKKTQWTKNIKRFFN